ncbi:sodium/glutamate symporter [Bdellovibrio sp. ZAP7]|uniref:sodium/glutamate symporter n=1 Tax=Bdellovibrio sp. ZAP7 TaxID=2231053 RepID=UPI00115B9BC7|nr:sodium/glutamate symporter [Bdellovibrio sp. ZAP7]QDK44523.1 sodium/glutamate symporter [Bdellovibrio sp. ZAP7]
MSFTALQTVAIAALVVYFGRYLKAKFHFIDEYNLPSPVIGGLLVALVISFLKSQNLFSIEFDKTFETTLMIAFFASVGYAASFKLLKKGGRGVLYFLLLAVGGLALQIIAGMSAAKIMGLNPLVGVLTGPVALTGGPGTALAFAPSFAALGIENASVIGLTTAMGGIVLGGLVGAPLATYLINKRNLESNKSTEDVKVDESQLLKFVPGRDLLFHALGLCLILGLGTTLSSWISSWGVTLPIYIGSMVIAAVFRNIEDATSFFKIKSEWIEEIGSVSLTLFIAMAIMSLRLEELQNAAGPILIFLIVQTLLVVLTALGPVMWIAGNNYESAVIAAGYTGFMMGTTANAMANMQSLTQKYGPAPKAFLIVPLVGSCFIDFINAGAITFCLNVFR